MNWLHTAIIVLHVLIATAIVALVLIQRGKGADAGAGFGAGASGTVFGAQGSASFLSRMTAMLAALFIGTNLFLAYMSGQQREAPSSTSVIDRVQTPSDLATGVPALPDSSASDSSPTDSTAQSPAAPASDESQPPQQ